MQCYHAARSFCSSDLSNKRPPRSPVPRTGSAKPPDPPLGAMPPGTPLRAPPQTPLIGLRSALAVASKPCQGPALTKAGSAIVHHVVTAGLVESNGSLPPGLWLTSPAGWLPRTGISSGTLRSVIEYGLPLPLLVLCSCSLFQEWSLGTKCGGLHLFWNWTLPV